MSNYYEEILRGCQERLENERKRFRRMPKEWRDPYLKGADWLKGTRELLFKKGKVVWGCVVIANSLLYQEGEDSCPALVLYRHGPTSPEALKQHAERLLTLHEEQASGEYESASEKEFILSLRDYLDHSTRPVPESLLGESGYVVTVPLVSRNHLPDRRLSHMLVPYLVAPDDTPSGMVLPYSLWSPSFRNRWLSPDVFREERWSEERQTPRVASLLALTSPPLLRYTWNPRYVIAFLGSLFALLVLPLITATIVVGSPWLAWRACEHIWTTIPGLRANIILGGLASIIILSPAAVIIAAILGRRSAPHIEEGITLDMQRHPDLARLISIIAQSLQAPEPDRVDITFDANASASEQREGLTLTLGILIFETMSVMDLAGIVAHELRHFSQNLSTRVSRRMSSTLLHYHFIIVHRGAVEEFLHQVKREGGWFYGTIFHIPIAIIWCMRFVFLKLYAIASWLDSARRHQMEFDSDVAHIFVSGAESLRRSHRKLYETDIAFEKVTKQIHDLMPLKVLCSDVPKLVKLAAGTLKESDYEAVNELLEQESWAHPSSQARIDKALVQGERGFISDMTPGAAVVSDYREISDQLTLNFYNSLYKFDISKFNVKTPNEYLEMVGKVENAERKFKTVLGEETWDKLDLFPLSVLEGDGIVIRAPEENRKRNEEVLRSYDQAFERFSESSMSFLSTRFGIKKSNQVGDERMLSSMAERARATFRSVLQKLVPEADHMSRYLSNEYSWGEVCRVGTEEVKPLPSFLRWHRESFVSRQLLKADCLFALNVIRELDRITAQPCNEELLEWSVKLEEEVLYLLQQSSIEWLHRESLLDEVRESIEGSKALVLGYDRLCHSCAALLSVLSEVDELYRYSMFTLTTRQEVEALPKESESGTPSW